MQPFTKIHSFDKQTNELNAPEQQIKTPLKWLRYLLASAIILFALATACLIQVQAGQAVVITRFGSPARVLLEPGINWRMPIPFESATPIDLRLRTTSSGMHDVGTKDGLRIIMQAYIIWQIEPNADAILQFMRAITGNASSEAANQIRMFTGSALETTASRYDLENLVNTDMTKVQLVDFESHLKNQLESSLRQTYGIKIISVGLERLTLPSITLNATVERMRAERETIATERTAEGKLLAAEIRSKAERDARIMVANATIKAAEINGQSVTKAAKIYGSAYKKAPELYTYLRSLDTLQTIINENTRLILRTDVAPFNVLTDGKLTPPLSLKSVKEHLNE